MRSRGGHFRTAGQHRVDFAVLNHPHGETQRVSRGRAGGGDRKVRPGDLELDGQVPLTRLMMLPGMKNGDTFFGECVSRNLS